MNFITARAHTNIALIKYWGKKDQELFIPYNSSLSLTLDRFYTDTTVKPSTDEYDHFILNDEEQPAEEVQKIQKFLNLFRKEAKNTRPLTIESTNHVPTAAGLASSASAYAALAMALNGFFELGLDATTLSTYARKGSGSATRSLFGGFVEWEKGIDDKTSHAIKVDDGTWDIGLLICIVNDQKKKISSRKGMAHTVATSPFYDDWVKTSADDLVAMKAAIAAHDIEQVGQIAEHNAMKMHATTLSANPPFTYFEPESVQLIQTIQGLRKKGYHAYVTMDAGPNVKVVAPYHELESIKQELLALLPEEQLLITKAGPDAFILDQA